MPSSTGSAKRRRKLTRAERREIIRRIHLRDPVQWTADTLGEHIWSKEAEVLRSVCEHRYTSVHAAHDTSKSHAASRAVAWWLSVHPPGSAFAVTTAPSTKQVEAILWREIGRARRLGGLPGRITLDAQWYLQIDGEDELVAYGRKPQDLTSSEEAAAAFQGIHARYVLVVLDEASGIPLWLWNAVDTLVTNEHSRVLAIGNPDDDQSHFAKVCAPGSGWNVIHIDGLDSPNFTDEPVPDELRDVLLSATWVEERAKRWGEQSPMYRSKVRGLFTPASDRSIITADHVRQAQARDLSGAAIADPGHYGWDIARLGSDETVGYLNRGGMVRRIYARHRQTTDVTTGDIAAEVGPHTDRSSHVDSVGVGAGVYDALRAQGHNVHGFEAGEKAIDPRRFVNRRAEAWWSLREAFEDGLVDLDPDDEDLAAQLQGPRWWRDPRGRVVLESKDAMQKRGVASPDRGDAVVMAFLRESATVVREPAGSAVPRSITAGVLTEPM